MSRARRIWHLAFFWALIVWVGFARPLSRSASDPPTQVTQHGPARFMPQRALFHVRAIPAPARAEIQVQEAGLLPILATWFGVTWSLDAGPITPFRPGTPAPSRIPHLLC